MEQSVTKVVGRGTVYLAATTWVLKGVGIFSILLILNHLTVHEYGITELVTTVVPLLSIFLLPGLNTTLIADMGVEKAKGNMAAVKGMLINFVRLQGIFSVIIWAFVFFGAHFLSVWYGKGDVANLIRIMSFAFLLSPLRTMVQILLRVYLRFFQQSVYSVLEEVFKLCFLTLFFFVFHLRAEGLIAALVLSQAFALICMVPVIVRIDTHLWRAQTTRFTTFHLLRFHGKWSVFASYVGTFGKNIRPWIIGLFLGTEAVGLYAVVQGLIGHTVSLFPLDQAISSVFPQYVEQKERLHRMINKAIKYQLLGYVFVSVCAALFAPFFITWFFPQYVPAITLFQIMLIMLVSSAFDIIFASVFLAIKAQRNLFFASLYKLALTVILMPLCIHFFGLYGIAYANIVVNYLYVWERYRTLKTLLPGFTIVPRDLVSLDDFDQLILQKFTHYVRRAYRKITPNDAL